MGEPFVMGADQLITTRSLRFAVDTVVGESGIKAHSKVSSAEKLLYPYEFLDSILYRYTVPAYNPTEK